MDPRARPPARGDRVRCRLSRWRRGRRSRLRHGWRTRSPSPGSSRTPASSGSGRCPPSCRAPGVSTAARRTRSVRRNGRRASSAGRLANSCHRGRCLGTTRPCRLVRAWASAQPPSRRWVLPAVESQGPPTVRPGWRRAGFALVRACLGPPEAPVGLGRSAARATLT